MADDKKKTGPKVIVDTSILDEAAIERVRVKAKAKVEKERIAAAEAQLLEEFELEERRANGSVEAMVDITIDLAPYADRLMIDGKILFNGQTKTVKASEADVIREMMQATWQHQSIVDGKSENFYRRSRGQRITIPQGEGSSHILRA